MTYQTHVRFDDDLAEDVKAYAATYGISIADAIRVLCRQALELREKQ